MNDFDGYEVKKLTRGPRFCRTCENYKPPRAHHCRQCKRCVVYQCFTAINLRRRTDACLEWVCNSRSHCLHFRSTCGTDHHCPWVNNCVGHFNYGHFIRFLFYVDIACTYHFTMLTKRVLYSTTFWVSFPADLSLRPH